MRGRDAPAPPPPPPTPPPCQNLHLVVGWLPVLEKELAALKPHARFRLWLTTECHNAFPPVLLQQSLKVTFEAP